MLADARRFVPGSNTWEPTGSMAEARTGAKAVALHDGDVLVVGGHGEAGPLASVVRYPQNDPPMARSPVGSLRLGVLGERTIPVFVSWAAAVDSDGIASYQLQHQANDAPWQNISLDAPTRQSVTRSLAVGRVHGFRVRATDILGATGSYAAGSDVTLNLWQENASGITYEGVWSAASGTGLSGESSRFTGKAGTSATVTFRGGSIAWVTSKGPGRGKARIELNGVTVGTIDLYAPTVRTRQIVFARNGLGAGVHTLRIVVLGTKNAVSTGKRVDLDAIAIIR
jgi:hypothetical protein